jgi:hypothetical protein
MPILTVYKVPKVTKYFIRHVDCSNLEIKKETQAKLSFSERRALGIQTNQQDLKSILWKIQDYQKLNPAKFEAGNVAAGISKATVGEKLFGSGSIALCAGLLLSFIGANFGAAFGQNPPSNHVELVHLFFEGTLFSMSSLGITMGVYSSRRDSAKELLNYFVKQENHHSTPTEDIRDMDFLHET